MCAIDHCMNEGEPIEEFADQYRDPEPENKYREQEPGRFRRLQVQSHPLMHILSQFYKHNLLAFLQNCIYFDC